MTPDRTIPLNPRSHHVRTAKKKPPTDDDDGDDDDKAAWRHRQQHGLNDMDYLEQRLVESIRLDESMRLTVNERISRAIEKGVLHVPVTAFLVTSNGGGCMFVDDFRRQLCVRYEVELLGLPISLTREHLSLDLFHYDTEYRRIIGILIYLTSLKPPLRCVISRQPIAITPRALDLFPPDSETPVIISSDSDDGLTTTAITTTTTTTTSGSGDANNMTTTTTRIIHNNNNNNGPDSRMVIPAIQNSAFDRFMYNCTRLRQTGHYYMLYVDLPLSINTTTTTTTTTTTKPPKHPSTNTNG